MNIHHRIIRNAWLGAALAVALPTHADEKTATGLTPYIIVNGQPISQNSVALIGSSLGNDKGQAGNGSADAADRRNAARAELITEELLAQEARKAGLDRKPAVADQLAFQQRELLSRAYLEDYFDRNPVTEASLKSAYEFNRANGRIVEYKVRQILVQTSAQAAELVGKLDQGADFAALASQYSQDPGGQTKGGDLGWFRPDIFVDRGFTDAVVALRKNEYTHAPVRTRFGWHVIKVEDGPRPVANPEPYDALADNVKQALRQRAAQAQIEGLTARLTASAKISGPGAPVTGGASRSSH